MNQIMAQQYPVFEMYQSLRNQLMELLSDEDLEFSIAGNPTLGELCREIGEVQHAYIQSFRTFTIDFSYRNREPGLANSVSKLTGWFQALDAEMKQTVASLEDEAIQKRVVDRGGDFQVPPSIQLAIYQEALLIFYGKARVYLGAMGKELPQQWQEWIG